MRTLSKLIVAVVPCLVVACGSTPPADEAGNPTADSKPAPTDTVSPSSFADFSERVDEYMKQRERAQATVPELKETSDPKEVSGRERALADAIRTVRKDARPGDVFSEASTAEFRRVVKADFEKRPARDQTAILAEVPMDVPPKVNSDYPTTLPLATVPPGLLLNLPTLPDVLEYRLLGRHLILRDVAANLIVDYVPNVVPA